MKYLVALLQLGTVSVAFLPIFNIFEYNLSFFGLVRTIFAEASDWVMLELAIEYSRGQMRTLAFIVLIFAVVIILGWIGTLMVSYKSSYAVALCSAFVNNLLFAFVCIHALNRFEGLLWLTTFDRINLNPFLIGVWVILNVGIVGVSSWGFIAVNREQVSYTDDFITEDYNKGKIVLEEPEKYTGYRPEEIAPFPPIKKPSSAFSDTICEDEAPSVKSSEQREFCGALIGKNGKYANKVYLLKRKRPVYFQILDEEFMVTESCQGRCLAMVYYIPEYEEYCLEPMERRICFLFSGQPLGENRRYYLPRGAEIYIKDKNNCFTLA